MTRFRSALDASVSILPMALLAATLAAAPVSIDLAGHHLGPNAAFANNGGGHGGGNGGGNGHAGGNGNAGGNGGNGGGAGGNSADASSVDPSNHGAVASSLGALNAAHASTTALANAAPNSRVGRIAAYDKVVKAEDTLTDPNATPEDVAAAQAYLDSQSLSAMTPEDAEQATLEKAANKTVTDQVVDAVNSLLGL